MPDISIGIVLNFTERIILEEEDLSQNDDEDFVVRSTTLLIIHKLIWSKPENLVSFCEVHIEIFSISNLQIWKSCVIALIVVIALIFVIAGDHEETY